MKPLKKKYSKWTNAQKKYLQANYSEMKDVEIAKKLRKTLKAVREMRSRMGIKKQPGRPKND